MLRYFAIEILLPILPLDAFCKPSIVTILCEDWEESETLNERLEARNVTALEETSVSRSFRNQADSCISPAMSSDVK